MVRDAIHALHDRCPLYMTKSQVIGVCTTTLRNRTMQNVLQTQHSCDVHDDCTRRDHRCCVARLRCVGHYRSCTAAGSGAAHQTDDRQKERHSTASGLIGLLSWRQIRLRSFAILNSMSIPRRVRFRTTTNSFGAAAADFLRSRTGCRGSSGAYGGGDGFLSGRTGGRCFPIAKEQPPKTKRNLPIEHLPSTL